jgi:hypothetical protein
MFCPKCGNPDQQPEAYCRKCGIFLPDLDKRVKKDTPQEHVKVNLVLSSMTIAVSFILAILLYAMLAFRESTHPLIYVTAGLLIAMGIWHIQTLYRTLQLRKHFRNKRFEAEGVELPASVEGVPTGKFLNEPDLSDAIPASVTETTTKHLGEKIKRKSS